MACRQVAPAVSRLQQKYSGKIEFIKLDADDPATKSWGEKYRVQYLPTFVFLDKSGKVVDQAVGSLPEEELEQKIQNLLQKSP